MAAVPMPIEPPSTPLPGSAQYDDPVHAGLQRHGIQASVGLWPQQPNGGPWRRIVRISAAPYVDRADFELLARVLPDVLARAAR
jgi:hypothetical protein